MVFGRRQNKNGTLALINSLILIQQDCICNNFDLAFLFSLDNKRGIIYIMDSSIKDPEGPKNRFSVIQVPEGDIPNFSS